MIGLRYQLKSIRKDKMCIISFFLPIVMAVLINLVGTIDISSIGELQFGTIKDNLSTQTEQWLSRYGSVKQYQTESHLISEVKNIKTNTIGVVSNGKGIQTIVYGNEINAIKNVAKRLPRIFRLKGNLKNTEVTILPKDNVLEEFQNIFIAMILITAMFMGCTFNAMNIISEKEDGISFINEILPQTRSQYIIQKIFIGFLCGCLSSIVTVFICLRISILDMVMMLLLIVFSTFISSLIGLFIGKLSEGLMIGIIYIKLIMILFIGAPLLVYLLGFDIRGIGNLCYIMPSIATFKGIMEIIDGNINVIKEAVVLAVHCIAWFLLYMTLDKRRSLFFSR
ncbi:ABC transporter permease [Clostridioides sp. ES-S-0005-03]|uniref:ABC transporter permease n=1 Tax=Clostridioides sp. ES-S-0005-03 TaxID=2770774 RepID=UPI001D115FD3|nr:ABC transporter permease [Clostridioides sp. ES-S-0005-03]UDN47070.1 ABC transporter permease [Clostridioides sp. ES-S-0173-01]